MFVRFLDFLFGMFQSPSLRGSGRFMNYLFQLTKAEKQVSIPFIAGQWSLLGVTAYYFVGWLVSIPFIAGQWSLLQDILFRTVGIYQVSIPFIAGQWSLHRGCHGCWKCARLVSIPFIAGQWSLLGGGLCDSKLLFEFQSPSLRGSGRFVW